MNPSGRSVGYIPFTSDPPWTFISGVQAGRQEHSYGWIPLLKYLPTTATVVTCKGNLLSFQFRAEASFTFQTHTDGLIFVIEVKDMISH